MLDNLLIEIVTTQEDNFALVAEEQPMRAIVVNKVIANGLYDLFEGKLLESLIEDVHSFSSMNRDRVLRYLDEYLAEIKRDPSRVLQKGRYGDEY